MIRLQEILKVSILLPLHVRREKKRGNAVLKVVGDWKEDYKNCGVGGET